MSCNCQDILNEKLCDIPIEWRLQIVEAICQVEEYDYECKKSCQDITFLSHFRNENNQVCISYIDEYGKKFDRCFDFDLTSTILNDLILPDCVPLPAGLTFKDLNFNQKFQHIIDILCQSCCGIPITTTTTTTCAIITSVIGGTGFTTTTSSTTTSTTKIPTTTTTSSTTKIPTTSTSTTTSTTINCCQGGGFHALPLPGSSSSIISNGVTITASYTVPTSPLGVKQIGPGTLCPSCYPCGNYSYLIGSGVPISTVWGPTYAWDYILNFSQPIKSINLFILSLSSTEKFDIPTQTYFDGDLEGIEFTTNTGKPNIELCEGCNVNVQGNKIYAESAMIGHTGVKNGSGIFRISSNTPFSTLKMTDIRIFTNSSVCYYCGPDYPSAISWALCGQVSK